MLFVAGFFDILQFGTGIIIFMGSLVSSWVAWIPLIGQFIGGAIMFASSVLQGIIGWTIIGVGYGVMVGWFLLSGVPFMSGKNVVPRTGVMFIALVIDFMPLINILPGLFLWTATQVYFSRKESKENKKEEETSNLNTMRMRRRRVEESEALG